MHALQRFYSVCVCAQTRKKKHAHTQYTHTHTRHIYIHTRRLQVHEKICMYVCVYIYIASRPTFSATVLVLLALALSQYAKRQILVLTDDGFVFLGSRGVSLAVLKVSLPD